MRKTFMLLTLVVVVAACGVPVVDGGAGTVGPPTTVDPEEPVDSGGDEPITDPGPVGSIPEPRLPIDGNIDGEVWVSSADLRIMESYPIQVMLDVAGDKPSPCHEIFWTAEDTGEVIEIEMLSQTASDQTCAAVTAEFVIAVPLGSWADAEREVVLNGESVGSFES
jgi:hypothetical protein